MSRIAEISGQSLVSVVIPAYRAETFIEETIESVRAQTWRPIEVVVVDDGSPDATAAVVERVAAKCASDDFAVRLVRREVNGGVTAAVLTGFSAAAGEYVCWLSADDLYVDPEKSAKQVRVMRKGASFVYATSFLRGASIEDSIRVEGHWSFKLSRPIDWMFNRGVSLRVMGYMFGNAVNGSTVMMRKDLMDEYGRFDLFDESGQNMDSDSDLWMRLSALGVPFHTIAGPAALYRIHGGQVSQERTAEWMKDCQTTRARLLLAFDELDRTTALLNRSWPALVIALRGGYRTFPQVAMAVCKRAERSGVGILPRALCGRLKRQLQMESLWDEAAFDDTMSRATKAMQSVEFALFRDRLRERVARGAEFGRGTR